MEVNHEGDWEVWDLCLLMLINAECLFFQKEEENSFSESTQKVI